MLFGDATDFSTDCCLSLTESLKPQWFVNITTFYRKWRVGQPQPGENLWFLKWIQMMQTEKSFTIAPREKGANLAKSWQTSLIFCGHLVVVETVSPPPRCLHRWIELGLLFCDIHISSILVMISSIASVALLPSSPRYLAPAVWPFLAP